MFSQAETIMVVDVQVIHTGHCTGETSVSSAKQASTDVTDPPISMVMLTFIIAVGLQSVL